MDLHKKFKAASTYDTYVEYKFEVSATVSFGVTVCFAGSRHTQAYKPTAKNVIYGFRGLQIG